MLCRPRPAGGPSTPKLAHGPRSSSRQDSMRSKSPLSVALAAGALVLTLARCAEPPAGPSAAAAPSLSTTETLASGGESLLACREQAPRDFSFTLDARGGRVSRGGVVLDVPAGAIPGRQEFVLTLPRSPYLEIDLDAVGHEHYTFAHPISVTMNYARCGNVALSAPALSVWNIDSSSKTLLERMSGSDDRKGKWISFYTDHLSGYAVAYRARTENPADPDNPGE